MTRQQDVRRLISECTAALDEFEAQADHRARSGRPISYSDGVLLAVIPMLSMSLTGLRDQVDTMNDEQIDALISTITPVVEIRRLALENRMRRLREAEEAARPREDGP